MAQPVVTSVLQTPPLEGLAALPLVLQVAQVAQQELMEIRVVQEEMVLPDQMVLLALPEHPAQQDHILVDFGILEDKEHQEPMVVAVVVVEVEAEVADKPASFVTTAQEMAAVAAVAAAKVVLEEQADGEEVHHLLCIW